MIDGGLSEHKKAGTIEILDRVPPAEGILTAQMVDKNVQVQWSKLDPLY